MAQYISVILVAVLMAITGSWAQEHPVIFIPTLYVTSDVEHPTAQQEVVYQANICNTTTYNNMMVITRVNMPSGWNPDIGRVAKLQVCTTSDCSKVLCTNHPGGKFNGQHNCAIAYNTSLTAMYVSATAGNSPYNAWTVAMEFLPKDQYVEEPNKHFWFYRLREFPEPIPINLVTPADVKILQQVIPSGSRQSVTTLNRQDFKLAFCPDGGTTLRYNVDIVVSALDSVSAMATYVCEPPVDPTTGCRPNDAKYSDPRGIAINVVTLATRTGSLRDLYVAVVGWGDGEQTNRFSIGATITKIS